MRDPASSCYGKERFNSYRQLSRAACLAVAISRHPFTAAIFAAGFTSAMPCVFPRIPGRAGRHWAMKHEPLRDCRREQ